MGAVTASTSDAPARPTLVRWPRDAARRREAATAGRPCLLVVAPGAERPIVGELEDWITDGSSERDVANRLERLERLASGRSVRPATVVEVPDGLDARDRAVARVLLQHAGHLVARPDLLGDQVDDGSLDGAVRRIRRALPIGWSVRRVAAHGFVAIAPETP